MRNVLGIELTRYLGEFRHARDGVFYALSCAVIRAASAAILALLLREILSDIVNHAHISTMTKHVVLASVFCGILALSGFGTRTIVTQLSQDMLKNLRLSLVAKFLTYRPQELSRLGRAHIQSVAMRDTDAVDAMNSALLGVILPSSITASALVAILTWISPAFGVLCLVMALAFWALGKQYRASIEANISAYASEFAKYNRGILVTLERLLLIRISGVERHEHVEREKDIERLRQTGARTDRSIAASAEVLGFVGNFATVLLLASGAVLAAWGLALDDLLSIYMVLFLIRTQAVGLSTMLPEVRRGMVSLRRVWQLTDRIASTAYTGKTSFRFRGEIEMEMVSFSYETSELLSNISLHLRQGTCTVLTGPNGSGKTTLLNIILGLEKPTSGRLTASGIPYEEIDFSILREATSFLPQDPVIFDGTIAENIAYGRPSASRREVEIAADLAGATQFINQTSQGFDSPVGDEGALLSGGEKQRISLARALLGRPQLLIMDEPSNHLDSSATTALVQRLSTTHETPAILIVTHEARVMACADVLLDLRDGVLSQIEMPVSLKQRAENTSAGMQ